ncbi:hypothetical protein K438DRAFT_1764109 [Mycena galopus ATCC 62051]|nr:hypothetical protein K438DRAFT_1764109 [Mycena galopus ATCC 62051]
MTGIRASELGPPPVTVTATAVEMMAVFLDFKCLTGWDGRDGRRNGNGLCWHYQISMCLQILAPKMHSKDHPFQQLSRPSFNGLLEEAKNPRWGGHGTRQMGAVKPSRRLREEALIRIPRPIPSARQTKYMFGYLSMTLTEPP